MKKGLLGLLASALTLALCGPVNATMVDFVTYTEKGAGLSVDAKGLDTGVDGVIRASIPTGSTVYKAYLYSASVGFSGTPLSDVVLEGTTLTSNAASRLDTGARDGNSWVSENRWDVTSIVQSKVGGGSGTFNFSLRETGYLDGEILAVLYSNPTKPLSTAFLFDGELSTTGDTFNIFLTTPVNKADPNFTADMSLGISYSYQPSSQYSIVDINGNRLTTSAGGQDDGFAANGGLITAGGIGDSNTNPANPFADGNSGPRYDDELYSLVDLLNNGDTLITIATNNPSGDDNVFFTGFSTLGQASIEPIGPIPEPSTFFLFGIGLVGAGLLRKRMKR
jgi:hypothetical protein